ncbi:hypothetical protein [Flavilitoribacter nigricans]|uniref:Uncharacterized protein n=1 Tax=Flavilitoribacter nigricans (strain ATCC 23147 / DSM 23189 / NBRC 102662 / NCIMB 1420 / SS-2) TaxID=1122177 RepID=A0A2D0N2T0_FLAN2|nr:hypothetical protein [Flavilitoribacter nigricans]PHN02698.1 hypothetical protein CRP01_30410 [Flavilitoribacter nigricans DSM 23189 = NBRC 102662]
MYSSKLLNLLKTLSAEEMRWMAKFVRSPYHNSNKEVIALFDHLRKFHPKCDSASLSRDRIFQKIWPQTPYQDRQLRLLMFRLSNLIEAFLVAQQVKQDQIRYDQLLVSALAERDLYDLFVQKNQALTETLEQQPLRDERYYELLWQLKLQWTSHPETVRLQIPTKHLHETGELLDSFYAIAKLRYSSDLLNRQNILPENYSIFLLEELRKLAPENAAFQDNKVVLLYCDLLHLIEQPLNEAYYRRFEANFTLHQDLLKRIDRGAMLRCLINAATQLYIAGKTSYLNNQYQWFLSGLEADLFTENGRLPESTFLNIVVTATILRKVDWTRDFIDQYSALMSANMLNFAKAYWHFSRREFQESNTFLARVKEQDFSHQLRKKLLSVRNHFEIFCNDYSYYSLFLDESRAFEKFVRRNEQLTERRAKAYLNFLTCVRKIGKLRSENKRVEEKQKARLIEEIAGLQPLEARPWLLEKINEV